MRGYAGHVIDPSHETPRQVTGRLVRMGEAERDFDEQFWRAIPGKQRVEMLWDMVLDALAVKGITEVPRLQRSVGCIRRP